MFVKLHVVFTLYRFQLRIYAMNHYYDRSKGILNYRLIKFLVPVNIHFSPYKIKSQFLVPMTFSLSILGTKNVDRNFL